MTRNGYHVSVLLLSILMRGTRNGYRGARAGSSDSSDGFMFPIACLTNPIAW